MHICMYTATEKNHVHAVIVRLLYITVGTNSQRLVWYKKTLCKNTKYGKKQYHSPYDSSLNDHNFGMQSPINNFKGSFFQLDL